MDGCVCYRPDCLSLRKVLIVTPDNPRSAELALVVHYAPAAARAGLTALLALDDTLSGLVRSVRTPLAAQLKLAWWREALAALETATAPEHPVLVALAAEVVPRVSGARLAGMADGWEALLTGDLAAHARDRGRRLFEAGAALVRAGDPWLGSAGEMMAVAQLRLGQRAAAGQTFGRIARDENAPASLRQRAVQMAGVLGVDAVPAATANGSPANQDPTR